MADRLVMKLTHGADDPERCLVGLNVAAVAVASGFEVSLFLAFDGVRVAEPGFVDGLELAQAPPGRELLEAFLSGGGTLVVCSACALRRGLVEADFLPEATMGGSAAFVAEIAGGAQPLVY